jgi:hypothetical protein
LIAEEVEASRAIDDEIEPSARYWLDSAERAKFSTQSKIT